MNYPASCPSQAFPAASSSGATAHSCGYIYFSPLCALTPRLSLARAERLPRRLNRIALRRCVPLGHNRDARLGPRRETKFLRKAHHELALLSLQRNLGPRRLPALLAFVGRTVFTNEGG